MSIYLRWLFIEELLGLFTKLGLDFVLCFFYAEGSAERVESTKLSLSLPPVAMRIKKILNPSSFVSRFIVERRRHESVCLHLLLLLNVVKVTPLLMFMNQESHQSAQLLVLLL